MILYSITGEALYNSRQPSLKRTLAEAAAEGIMLPGINLRRARLKGAALDGLIAPGACLWGADLSGCDLAEADLSGADARMATFADTCLADVVAVEARFEGAYFRNVLLEGADFSGCAFSCPSILTQPLHLCRSLDRALYWHRGEDACALSQGISRLQIRGHELVALGDRLIVNGDLQKNFSKINTTKSSSIQPNIANCEAL